MLFGALEKVSVITNSFPGLYLTFILYRWIVMIIFCNAWYSDFFLTVWHTNHRDFIFIIKILCINQLLSLCFLVSIFFLTITVHIAWFLVFHQSRFYCIYRNFRRAYSTCRHLILTQKIKEVEIYLLWNGLLDWKRLTKVRVDNVEKMADLSKENALDCT